MAESLPTLPDDMLRSKVESINQFLQTIRSNHELRVTEYGHAQMTKGEPFALPSGCLDMLLEVCGIAQHHARRADDAEALHRSEAERLTEVRTRFEPGSAQDVFGVATGPASAASEGRRRAMNPLLERLPGLTGGMKARADALRRASEKHLAHREWIAVEQALAGADAYSYAVGEIEAWAKLHGENAEASVVAGLAPCSHPRPGESVERAEAIDAFLREVREAAPEREADVPTFLGLARAVQGYLCEAAFFALGPGGSEALGGTRGRLVRAAAAIVSVCAQRWPRP